MLYDPKWSEPKTLTAAEVFNGAADAIERFGHAKHVLRHRGLGAMCLSGAINYASTGDAHTHHPDRDAWVYYLGHQLQWEMLVMWNDAPERTKEEVVALLREVAVSAA